MNKKVIVGIALGAILLTSIVGVMNLSPQPDTAKIKDIEKKREENLNFIDWASVSWQQGTINSTQFIAIIDKSLIDTEALRQEYLSLNIHPTYDKYKRLSLDSLDKQKEAFLKLKEYVQTENSEARKQIRSEFDQLITASFEYRRDALREVG